MNQEYRERVKRHLESGGDPKYVNVKRKADARHEAYSKEKKVEVAGKMNKGFENKATWVKRQKDFHKKNGKYDSRTTMESQS